MDHLVAIDPGTTSAIVVLTIERNPKLAFHEVWHSGKPGDDPSEIVGELVQRFNYSIRHFAIEDQYLGKNANSMKILTRIGGRWMEACIAAGIPHNSWVAPRTWQTKILSSKWGSKRDQIDKMMRLVAYQDTKAPLTADECAAWCIGKYAVGEFLR